MWQSLLWTERNLCSFYMREKNDLQNKQKGKSLECSSFIVILYDVRDNESCQLHRKSFVWTLAKCVQSPSYMISFRLILSPCLLWIAPGKCPFGPANEKMHAKDPVCRNGLSHSCLLYPPWCNLETRLLCNIHSPLFYMRVMKGRICSLNVLTKAFCPRWWRKCYLANIIIPF